MSQLLDKPFPTEDSDLEARAFAMGLEAYVKML